MKNLKFAWVDGNQKIMNACELFDTASEAQAAVLSRIGTVYSIVELADIGFHLAVVEVIVTPVMILKKVGK